MPRRSARRPSVVITNKSASRLPGGLGTARTTPSPPPPIEPKTIAKSRQVTPGPRVQITNPTADRIARQK
jgi:hypothetical protein